MFGSGNRRREGEMSKTKRALMIRLRALQEAGSWRLAVLLTLIFFLSAPFYAMYAGVHPGILVVAICYFVGFLGLLSMYQSARLKDPAKKASVFCVGFICVLIAWVSLEALL